MFICASGCKVTYNAKRAIETAEQHSIDLILIDIDLSPNKMDGTDGTAAAQIILQKKDIPIVFLSSHIELEVVKKPRE